MTVWLDYSTLFTWNGNLTGIPRTVYSIEQALVLLGLDFRRVTINDDLQGFYNVLSTNDQYVADTTHKLSFKSGDILLSLGAFWAHACYNDEIKKLKDIGVRYYQLYYDLIPTKFPHFYEYGKGFGEYYGKVLRESLDVCDMAFFISDCSKKDIQKYYTGSNKFQSKVIRLGEDFNYILDSGEISDSLKFGCDFILCVGTLEKRKNQNMLLDAYRMMLSSDNRDNVPMLCLVGREGWLNGDLVFQIENDPILLSKVVVCNHVTDGELEYLYNKCLFTVFPSLYEGWGLPISESLKRGKLCIASNNSSMVEIAPELTILLNPYTPADWAEKILELAKDKRKLLALTKNIRDNYRPYAWRETANAIIKELNI